MNGGSPTLEPTPEELERWQQLLGQLTQLGLYRRGSLLQRSFTCGKDYCRCHAPEPRLHGPYWQWTRKLGGKTQTTRGLATAQVELLQHWIENAHQLDHMLAELDHLSVQVTDRILAAAKPPSRR